MILEQIFTTPKPLFKNIEFAKGLNIIYAFSDEDNANPSKTIHAVGKSLLIDFIQFALLINMNKLSRIENAYSEGILKGSNINLIFSVNNKSYKITRSFDKPKSEIYFGEASGIPIKEPYANIKEKLFNLFFSRIDYSGLVNENWYEQLISFYAKTKKRDELFTDPIRFNRNMGELFANPFHLFLLNINNTLPFQNQEIVSNLKKLTSAKSESERLIVNNSEIRSVTELLNKRDNLQNRFDNLNKQITDLSFSENYKDLETKADELTAKIKKLIFQNFIIRNRIKEIAKLKSESKKSQTNLSEDVAKIYNQVNQLLANSVEKSLDEAVSFRKNLYESRNKFIKGEAEKLESKIYVSKEKIEKHDKERQEIYQQLSKLDAFDDLKSIYSQLTKIQHQIFEIDKSLKSLDALDEKIEELTTNDTNLEKDVNEYLSSISNEVNNFRNLITSVFDKLFLDSHSAAIFNISETNSKQKIKISVLEGSVMDSTGKNQLRTLIYDLAVSLNIIDQNLNAPRFIIHDGIFENLDKSHFFAFIKFIKELSDNGTQFQYILTLNEHNYYNEIEDFEKNEILANSIIELTPNSKLLGQDF